MWFINSCSVYSFFCFFFFKQKTVYERRISDWSSDVGSSDLDAPAGRTHNHQRQLATAAPGDGFDLAAKAVAGIQHQVVVAIEQLAQVGRGQKRVYHLATERGVDRKAALGQHLALAAPEIAIERLQLPAGVADPYIVCIDTGQTAP